MQLLLLAGQSPGPGERHALNRLFEWSAGAALKEKLTVAVIDSGVDYNHPDLRNMIWRNNDEICNNGIDDDRNGLVDDCLGWVSSLHRLKSTSVPPVQPR